MYSKPDVVSYSLCYHVAGVISTSTNADFDIFKENLYKIDVIVRDFHNTSVPDTLTVSIDLMNQSPYFEPVNYTASLPEHTKMVSWTDFICNTVVHGTFS